jgi:hypothetical protein
MPNVLHEYYLGFYYDSVIYSLFIKLKVVSIGALYNS